MASRPYSYAVVYRRSFNQAQVGPMETYATKAESETIAHEFNRSNQDNTWDAVIAHVINLFEGQSIITRSEYENPLSTL